MATPADLRRALPNYKTNIQRQDRRELQVGIPSGLRLVLTLTRRRFGFHYLLQRGVRGNNFEGCHATNGTYANRRGVVSNLRDYSFLRRVTPYDATTRVYVTFIVKGRLRATLQNLFKGDRVEVMFQIVRQASELVKDRRLSLQDGSFYRGSQLFQVVIRIRVRHAVVPCRLCFTNRSISANESYRTTYRKSRRGIATVNVDRANLPSPFQEGKDPSRVAIVICPSVLNRPYRRFRQFYLMYLDVFL